jgi:hypothetical protein
VKTPVKTTKALLGILTITLVLVIQVQAQFNYTINNGAITITEYTGSGGAVSIPSTINGLPVSGIGESAFYHRTNLTGVTSYELRVTSCPRQWGHIWVTSKQLILLKNPG